MRGGRTGLARLLALVIVGLMIVVACTSEETSPSPTSEAEGISPVTTPTPVPSGTPTPPATAVPTATATVVLSPTPSATPRPPTPTPTSTPSPSPTPEPLVAYMNELYGFSVLYPTDWTVLETDRPAPVASFDTGSEDLSVQAFVFYYPDRLTVLEAAEQELAPLAGLPNFRTISETPVTAAKGTETYQILYAFGTGREERRGGMAFAVENSHAFVLHAVGPRTVYENNLTKIEGFLSGIKLEAQQPFGIPRDEALVLALDSGPITLDPAIAQENQSTQYIGQVFGGLVALDPDLNVVPNLATWQVSEDGLTYTFTIDDGATFHDGSSVDAADVVFSWERAADPDIASHTVRTYMGDIVGVGEKLAGTAESISGLEIIDDRTLSVTIDSPKSYFISKLTHTVASVVERENVTAGGGSWWLEPVGTGPFKVAEWIPDVAMHMQRHDGYHGTLAQVPNVIFRFHAGVPLLMLEDDEIDAETISIAEFRVLQAEESPLLDQVTTRPLLSVHAVGFNASMAPFDDVNVRRAFQLALDRQVIVEETLDGVGVLAQGFLPPDLPGYDADIAEIQFTPAAAQAALASSTYGSADALPEITFTAPRIGPALVQMIQMWQENLGVSVGVNIVPAGSYYYELESRVQGLFEYGWIADYPDPHNFLDVLFHSEADNNVSGFGSAEVDDLLTRARVETDPDERTRLYRSAERIIVANAAGIPLWFDQARVLAKDYVEGFAIDAQGRLDLSKVSLVER
jgi:oligopeptide transport system substrate-binding protein